MLPVQHFEQSVNIDVIELRRGIYQRDDGEAGSITTALRDQQIDNLVRLANGDVFQTNLTDGVISSFVAQPFAFAAELEFNESRQDSSGQSLRLLTDTPNYILAYDDPPKRLTYDDIGLLSAEGNQHVLFTPDAATPGDGSLNIPDDAIFERITATTPPAPSATN